MDFKIAIKLLLVSKNNTFISTLQKHQKLMTEIRHTRMQLLPSNIGVYGELVFKEFYLYVLTYPNSLYVKKIAIMMRAVTNFVVFWE